MAVSSFSAPAYNLSVLVICLQDRMPHLLVFTPHPTLSIVSLHTHPVPALLQWPQKGLSPHPLIVIKLRHALFKGIPLIFWPRGWFLSYPKCPTLPSSAFQIPSSLLIGRGCPFLCPQPSSRESTNTCYVKYLLLGHVFSIEDPLPLASFLRSP